MKLHTDPRTGNTVTAHGDAYIAINGQRYSGSLIVQPEAIDTDWRVSAVSALQAADIEKLLASGADILILGTGKRQQFPPLALLKPVIAAGRTLDVMDTPAACRTYNILMSEGRAVAAAIIIE
ncbi:MAG: Mth938-like domain-containing protein [Rhodocyclaceae bacterium]|nr:Mth938-like domain-containing protein [Rhodocyclaceae bacterium]